MLLMITGLTHRTSKLQDRINQVDRLTRELDDILYDLDRLGQNRVYKDLDQAYNWLVKECDQLNQELVDIETSLLKAKIIEIAGDVQDLLKDEKSSNLAIANTYIMDSINREI